MKLVAALFVCLVGACAAQQSINVHNHWGSTADTWFESYLDVNFGTCNWEDVRVTVNFDRSIKQIFEWDFIITQRNNNDKTYVFKVKLNPGSSSKTYKIQGQTTGGKPSGNYAVTCGSSGASTGGSSSSSGSGSSSNTNSGSTSGTTSGSNSGATSTSSATCTSLDSSVKFERKWSIGNKQKKFDARFQLKAPACNGKPVVSLNMCKKITNLETWSANINGPKDGKIFSMTLHSKKNKGESVTFNFQGTFMGKTPTAFATISCDGQGTSSTGSSGNNNSGSSSGSSSNSGNSSSSGSSGSSGSGNSGSGSNTGNSGSSNSGSGSSSTSTAEGAYLAPGWSGTSPPPASKLNDIYGEVLEKSILFYEAQRSGKLPANNRVPWRGDSALNDGQDVGHDLSGGWYDAGDHVKFNFPMAWSTAVLTWGLLEFEDAYAKAGQLDYMYESIRWPLEYLIKCHTAKNELYGQVGDGYADHSYWGRPEDMTMNRPSYKLTTSRPGSDLAAETAAAMAAGSIAFKQRDPAFSKLLLQHAKEVYDFADKYRGKYPDSISNAGAFYNSWSGYEDELGWGAAWLARATGDQSYMNKAKQHWNGGLHEFSWDLKTPGTAMLIYGMTKDGAAKSKITQFMDKFIQCKDGNKWTPKGLCWHMQWGPNRYSANAAAIAAIAANYGINAETNEDWAQGQIHYMLGLTSKQQKSFMVGFGNNPPQKPHHRSSSCPALSKPCNDAYQHKSGPNPQVLYGALVGGPGSNDDYTDDRNDYIKNEVACDYNAGFQTAVAGLYHLRLSGSTGNSNSGASSGTSGNSGSSGSSGNSGSSSNSGNSGTSNSGSSASGSNSGNSGSSNTGSGSSSVSTTEGAYLPVGWSGTSPPPTSKLNAIYGEVLEKSILFYEAQRSGKLPANNRVPWRGDSALNDGQDVGHDLSGGWYDAGDHVKFNFPMAWSTAVLTWGLLEFEDAYAKAGQLDYMYESIRWPLEYLIKCHTAKNELYGQVGDGYADHSYWGRPEDMTMNRPSYKLTTSRPGSDLAAETAAAMAAGSIAFKKRDPAFSKLLLQHAKEVYDFADKYRGKYPDSISNAGAFYNSWSGYEDELGWGAAWLARATGDQSYMNKAKQHWNGGLHEFSWDLKTPGTAMLIYGMTKDGAAKSKVTQFMDKFIQCKDGNKWTPKGLCWHMQWGPNRYSANAAAIATIAAKYGINAQTNEDWARGQIHYMLGLTSKQQKSFMVGFGNNPPQKPHHRSSSCPALSKPCNDAYQHKSGPNPQVLYGALVGGPGSNDDYTDDRNDYIKNEVACDYNAGFQTAVAGLYHLRL